MKKLLLAILIVVFAVPAFAYEIALPGENNKLNVYGSIRMNALYNNVNNAGKTAPAADQNDFLYGVQPNSRFGVRLNLGNFFGTVETNFSGDSNDLANPNGLGFRLLFAGYKFDNGLSVTVGRQFVLAETQLAYDNVFENDNGMTGYGGLSAQRAGMVKLGLHGFELAIISMTPYYGTYNGNANRSGIVHVVAGTETTEIGFAGGTSTVMDKIMPMFELAYNLDFSMLKGKIFASYVGLDVENKATFADISKTSRNFINSFTAGAVLKAKFTDLSLVLSGFYSMNGELTGKVKQGSLGNIMPTIAVSDVKVTADGFTGGDITGFEAIHSYGVVLSAGYDITPAFNVTIGGGINGSSSNDFKYSYVQDGTSKNVDYSLLSYGVFIVTPVKVNQYLMFLPTIGYYSAENRVQGAYATMTKDYKLTSSATLIAGAQIRVNF